ncbi:hypothetical protein BKA56DRAFT_727187 [Ilyonectria sp. MPI-CAGE-AT-0026]|nr:hypothetical protein BKA56DRAFT_727187 [Ilyonectria sp. MPI-CAGE-AT-0026]
MQFFQLALFGLAAMVSVSDACKCYRTNGGTNNGATHKCCNDLGGVWQFGNDCRASSISEHLRGFDLCCKGQGSDCDYPHKRDEAYWANLALEQRAYYSLVLDKGILDLVKTFGPNNTFISMYERGSLDHSKDTLRERDNELQTLEVSRNIT